MSAAQPNGRPVWTWATGAITALLPFLVSGFLWLSSLNERINRLSSEIIDLQKRTATHEDAVQRLDDLWDRRLTETIRQLTTSIDSSSRGVAQLDRYLVQTATRVDNIDRTLQMLQDSLEQTRSMIQTEFSRRAAGGSPRQMPGDLDGYAVAPPIFPPPPTRQRPALSRRNSALHQGLNPRQLSPDEEPQLEP